MNLDIDMRQLTRISDELQGTEKQIKAALRRAIGLSAARLRKQSEAALKKGLPKMKDADVLRRRLKALDGRAGEIASGVWVGLNDIDASNLAGRPRKTKTGLRIGKTTLPNAFLAPYKNNEGLGIFKRRGRARLPLDKVKVSIEDKALAVLQHDVFAGLEKEFWKDFRRELRARTMGLVG